jgi:dTDP-4-amino-4,6-dideoxygalactose transaminase
MKRKNQKMKDKILVTKSSMPSLKEYVEEIEILWENHWLTNMGIKHQELEKRLQVYLDVPVVELVTNGHMALELALQAMALKDEVITTPFTFCSTTQAILRSGLTPVFCDINSNNYTIDVTKMESLINERTCAILPVHVYGNICDVEKIEVLAKKYSLPVIYDAAHAFGETYKGKSIAAFGDISCFSFHATKVFNTIEGGAICCQEKKLAERIQHLKNFGIANGEVQGVGTNAKMNEFCAAMGLCNLRHIDEEVEKRKRCIEVYKRYLEGVKGLKLNLPPINIQTNAAYFPVIFEKDFCEDIEKIRQRLKENGVEARRYFYPPTNEMPLFAQKEKLNQTPVAHYVSERVLTLPLYADLTSEEIEKICEVILNCRRVE